MPIKQPTLPPIMAIMRSFFSGVRHFLCFAFDLSTAMAINPTMFMTIKYKIKITAGKGTPNIFVIASIISVFSPLSFNSLQNFSLLLACPPAFASCMPQNFPHLWHLLFLSSLYYRNKGYEERKASYPTFRLL